MKKTLKQIVEETLKTKPHTRDNDWELVLEIYEAMGVQPQALTGWLLMKKIAQKEFQNPEAILRWRRRLQQMNPDLRGNFWKQRMDRIPEVREELEYAK
jgi:hypothetical protein